MAEQKRKLPMAHNLDKRIREAKRKQEWIWKRNDLTASAKWVCATQQQAIEMALTRLRDESQIEGAE